MSPNVKKKAFFGVKIDETPKMSKVNSHLFFGEMNFINKSCRGRPCGHYGMIIMQIFGHFINEIIARNCT